MSSPSPLNADAVRAAVEAVVSSAGFKNSDRMVRFLRVIAEKALSGEVGGLKEYTLGVEVFDRDQNFDPKNDTIVRVEARRLRRKLEEYYQGAGAQDSLRIEMPAPGYAPVFVEVPALAPVLSAAPEAATAQRSWITFPLMAATLLVLIGLTAWWWMTPARGGLTSVAVLPFANMSGDPSQEYFSDGFTEELIDRLTGVPNLRVAARTSSFQFKGRAFDVREIARRLNVDAVVEGSLRREKDTVRITAQLIRASDGYHVWSRTWDRQGKSVLEVETEVASAIAESYRSTLRPAHAAAPSLEAHDLYLIGRSHWHTLEPPELFKAIAHFEQAIAIAPNYAMAYSGLSEAYSYLIDMDIAPTRELAPKARAAAEKALALDPTLAEAHTSLGLVKMDAEWDFPGAAESFQRAFQLKPSFAYGIHWYAHYLENVGRVDEGCAEMQRASALDPLDRMYQMDISMCRYKQLRFADALTQLSRARQLDPQWPMADLGECVIAIGRKDGPAALAAGRRTETAMGAAPIVMVLLAQSEALAGNREGARTQLARLQTAAHREYVPAYAMSLAHYSTGDIMQGYTWLRRAWDDRNGTLVWLGYTPIFDPARRDPRAARLLKHVGDRRFKPE